MTYLISRSKGGDTTGLKLKFLGPDMATPRVPTEVGALPEDTWSLVPALQGLHPPAPAHTQSAHSQSAHSQSLGQDYFQIPC